ncbi:propionyl-coenzyme A carboxylase alpha polypeptide (plasmid) [Sinorhizobium fredii]|nr:propionyl-coenzyme A carboxylase alpha polypeptide [Sinorhizobium fredii]
MPAISPTRGENTSGFYPAPADTPLQRMLLSGAERATNILPLVGEMAGRPEGVNKRTTDPP